MNCRFSRGGIVGCWTFHQQSPTQPIIPMASPVSNLNAIVNASGTNPVTGAVCRRSPIIVKPPPPPIHPKGVSTLTPCQTQLSVCVLSLLISKGMVTPLHVVVQSTMLSNDTTAPTTQGFLFDHSTTPLCGSHSATVIWYWTPLKRAVALWVK